MSTIILDCETVPSIDADIGIIAAAVKREQDADTFLSLCPALARVICVGMSTADGYETASIDRGGGELLLLQDVSQALTNVQRIITFAGAGFDVPLLIHRMRIHRVPIPTVLIRAANAKPWEDAAHIDVLNLVTFAGKTSRYSLDIYCRAYSIESPKQHGDGSSVLDMWINEQTEEIAAYCLRDVRATRELWQRVTGAVPTSAARSPQEELFSR